MSSKETLIDAYMKCDDIEGSYCVDKTHDENGGLLDLITSFAKQKEPHEGWSEVYGFNYSLAKEHPEIEITKPIDAASNELFIRCMKKNSLQNQGGKNASAHIFQEITLHMCRWVDTDEDGVIDTFQTFLEYVFYECSITSYDTDIDFEADDIPEEKISITFKKMKMRHFHPEESTEFGWDFGTQAEIQ
ncbi:type VI protein secretion system component Hcp [Ereboglobus sp. PH5-5]|uniref:hypothetical protein n=1 Tax=unclassified Ereboglobus TaxID=2626932 RepID=UPI00240707CE|nr:MULTISPECIES: hypothetical protein [unclassified Ereboglobus]MDF9826551.1 type VI protein secretion system component Hcp [Ereboglobus sp. PH5-10]MDF9832741.1 type VI protein secretion system component Hcp [Ereboglobus sp. PH5-5]